ncbi:dehydrogenase [Falsirhodobacter algicola]|uniref:Dehydrogenase n=1 Tax=Falsirhodobacter algicola TaxID=2692330 RepID=A0A8J8SJZ3_9RHOB|nr:dehydrogenase [Falsirhodobacter algicola]
MPIPLLCVLTACAASPAAEPPPALLLPCAAPVDLPDHAMTQAEVELAWGRDRGALRDCAGRLGGLADWAGD